MGAQNLCPDPSGLAGMFSGGKTHAVVKKPQSKKAQHHNKEPEEADSGEQWDSSLPSVQWFPSAVGLLRYGMTKISVSLAQAVLSPPGLGSLWQVSLWVLIKLIRWKFEATKLFLCGCSTYEMFFFPLFKSWVLTAALTVENSATALPFFLLDIIRFKTSPYWE